MIRGPVLPQLREGLWAVVSSRISQVEHGLELVMEGLDCSGGQLGAVDGLARDAGGAPVLVLLAVDGDALLLARTLAALDFAARVGGALVTAVPEARFCAGTKPRVIVVGTDASRASLEQVARMPNLGVQVCRLEPFRIAGTERFAVIWLSAGSNGGNELAGVPGAETPVTARAFVVPASREADWQTLRDLCQRIDASVRFDGDRHWQRITWQGHVLGELWSERDGLFGATAHRGRRELRSDVDLRTFTDQVLRAYSLAAGLDQTNSAAEEPAPAPERLVAPRHAAAGRGVTPIVESLRSVLATTRLSPEEYSALGGSALAASGQTETALADGSGAGGLPSSPGKPT